MNRHHILLVGDSGTGKTGSIAGLVNAGHKVYFLDLENGSRILENLSEHPENLEIEKVHDSFRFTAAGAVPERGPKSLVRIGKILDRWQNEVKPDDIVVIDSLTALGRCILRWAKAQNPALRDNRQHYMNAQEVMGPFVETLTSPGFPCHTICLTHITRKEIREPGSDRVVETRIFPTAIGASLGERLPTYFNNTFQAKTVGMGRSAKRVISSISDGTIDLKNTRPDKVESQYPIQTGLATLLNTL